MVYLSDMHGPWKHERPVWVYGKTGWHRATETGGGQAQTLCGKRVHASFLTQSDPAKSKDNEKLQDKPICADCQAV